jgi:hypothetical protein
MPVAPDEEEAVPTRADSYKFMLCLVFLCVAGPVWTLRGLSSGSGPVLVIGGVHVAAGVVFMGVVVRVTWLRRDFLPGISHRTFGMATFAIGLVWFFVGFAILYWAAGDRDPRAFSEPLSRPDAVYFTLTTATTTGYGDIQPLSTAARSIASAQMVVGLLVVAGFIGTAATRLSSPRGRPDHR